jgi:hypothetical protein
LQHIQLEQAIPAARLAADPVKPKISDFEPR